MPLSNTLTFVFRIYALAGQDRGSKRKGIWVGGSVPLGYASVNKKLVVLPEEAETVRHIFRRYLELGSIRDLAEDLDKSGIRTKRQVLSTGNVRGGIRFGVGGLAYLLRNRFLIGEVVYRGEVHRGEQEPILDRALFDAVQATLAAGANVRELKLKASPSILAGRIFDERGKRMTPTHTNKQGVRYRYYVSHALLQKRSKDAGSVTRVPAHEVETAVVAAVRDHLAKSSVVDPEPSITERNLIEQHVDRIIVQPQSVAIHLFSGQRPKPASNTAMHKVRPCHHRSCRCHGPQHQSHRLKASCIPQCQRRQ